MVESAAHKYPVVDLDEFERRLRGPALPPRVEADPLAELARLVNGDNARDQNAGLGDPFAPRPAPQHNAPVVRLPVATWDRIEPAMEAPEPVLRPTHDPLAAGELSVQEVFAREMAALHGTGQHTAYSGHEHQTPANDHGGPAGAGYHHDAGNLHADDGHDHALNEAQWQPPAAPRKSNRPFYIMGAISVIALLGIGGTFAMRSGASGGGGKGAPTIKAAETPVKVAPDVPGGTVVPNQSASILERNLGTKPAENVSGTKVVASVEQPVDLGQVAKPAAAAPARPVTTAVAPPPPNIGPSTGTAQDPRIATANPQASIFGEPKRVKTVSVKPDGSLISEIAPPPPPAAAIPAPPSRPLIAGLPVTAPSAAPATPAAAKPVAPKTTVRAAPVAKPAVAKPVAAKPDAIAEAAAGADPNTPMQLPSARAKANASRIKLAKTVVANENAAAAANGGFSVQLAAPPTEAEAKDKLSRLEKNYADALAGHALSIRQANSNGKTVYRVRANNLSREEAKALCDKMAAAGGKCFIAGT